MKKLIKIQYFLLIVSAIVMFSSCKKEEYLRLQVKFYDNNVAVTPGKPISISKDSCKTLELQITGVENGHVINLYRSYHLFGGGSQVGERDRIATFTEGTSKQYIPFCDIKRGDYEMRITLESKGLSSPEVYNFTIRIEDGENPPDPIGFECYFNGSPVHSNSTLTLTAPNSLTVKTLCPVPNGTKIFYKWNDELTTYEVFTTSNQAFISLPYLQGTTRSLEVWIDDYTVRKTFTVRSEGTPPPGGFECFVNGSPATNTINLHQTTSMTVKILHTVPSGTPVYYQWNADPLPSQKPTNTNQEVEISLPYTLPGKTAILKVWIDGYPEQAFLIRSEVPLDKGFICYVGGNLAPPTIHLYSSTQNTELEVIKNSSLVNNTLVYYKYDDEVIHQTSNFVNNGNSASINLVYDSGKTRILRVWINGFPEQVFLVQSN